jgi:hypothetical protein
MFLLQNWPAEWPKEPVLCEICDQWKVPVFWLKSPTETAVAWGSQSVFRDLRSPMMCADCKPKDIAVGHQLSREAMQQLRSERHLRPLVRDKS